MKRRATHERFGSPLRQAELALANYEACEFRCSTCRKAMSAAFIRLTLATVAYAIVASLALLGIYSLILLAIGAYDTTLFHP
jgi:hypothetical protein